MENLIIYVIIGIMALLSCLISFTAAANKDLNLINIQEGFNDQTGRYCTTCAGKTFNQCMRCFNCGFCVDKYGNGACIGGDYKGPYNFERCAYWYNTDPYSYMMQRNKNYQCSYGPRSSNRLIGI